MATFLSVAYDLSITQWLLGILAVSVIFELWSVTVFSAKTPGYQFINNPWLPRFLTRKHAHEYVEDGYAKFIKAKDQPFKMIWWSRECILLPPKYLQDLKRADFKNLSFFKNLADAFSLDYSVGDLYESDIMIDVVRKRLNTQLPALIPLLNEELDFAIAEEIGHSEEWKSFKGNQLLSRIMHRMTCRILAGEKLCRDKVYIDTSLKFMNSVVINALLSIMLPLGIFRGIIRSFIAYFHRRNLEAAVKIVQPVVEKRLQERNKQQAHVDAIEWTIDLAGSDPIELEPRRITLNILQNIWAGSAGPAALVTQLVYQTLMMPEYLTPLRNEALQVISTYGWTEKALNQLHLQDSFIKEVNRLYPLGSVTAARTIMNEPFRFHDGLTLPVGSSIAFPIGAIQKDPEFFTNPLTFNGFRFVDSTSNDDALKDKEGSGSAQTISPTNLVYGYGKHACPGRFYGIRKAKLTFSKLLIDYDMKWDCIPAARPLEFPVEGQFAPNLEQAIFFRKRAKSD